MAVPSILMVAPSGSTKLATSFLAPNFSVHSRLRGRAPTEDALENAIIMAAGLSSRLAPISYEKPKGLLRVRGEVLIERQLRQLQEAGVTDITVVVGYKKEYFFYLASKFGVRIKVNPQ